MDDPTQDQIAECIARLVSEGYERDVAAAIAYEEERRKSTSEGRPLPARADFLRAARKVARTGRSKDYLETALSAAREKLHPRDFAVIHQAARGRAGGLASARMRTSIEKALALSPQALTERELDDALLRGDLAANADARLGIDSGGERLAEMFWSEKARRTAVSKSDPGPGDVHVDKPIGEETAKDKLPGGEGDKTTPKDVDQDELKRGITHEMEHTDDPKIAEEIALDHLSEDPKYYTKLESIELSAKSEAQDLVACVVDVGEHSCTIGLSDGAEFVITKSEIDVEPGDAVCLDVDMTGEVSIKSGAALTTLLDLGEFRARLDARVDAVRHETIVPFAGPDDAPIVFVSGAPNELELARLEALVGPDGEAFADRYLAPLGLARSQVAIGFACPVLPRVAPYELGSEQTRPWKEHVASQLARWPGAQVVAVGKAAADALGDRALLWLPHPCAARMNEDRYKEQVDRKIRRLRKALDDGFVVAGCKSERAGELDILAGRVGETLHGGHGRAVARVMKASREKQIVYGVVLDPYEIDTQTEWVPPSEVESTAHEYLRKSRVLGREHVRKDNADLVESWCVHYPSPEDYRAAMSLLPHKSYVMPFGEDHVHSGAWVAGVHLSDEAWAAYKRGEITGFSIGGFSHKTTVHRSAMPKVEFVQLKEESAR
jgi:uracil-DNA glycosylase